MSLIRVESIWNRQYMLLVTAPPPRPIPAPSSRPPLRNFNLSVSLGQVETVEPTLFSSSLRPKVLGNLRHFLHSLFVGKFSRRTSTSFHGASPSKSLPARFTTNGDNERKPLGASHLLLVQSPWETNFHHGSSRHLLMKEEMNYGPLPWTLLCPTAAIY